MSRIGRKPINIPAGVTVSVDNGVVTVKGPKGTLTQKVHPNISVEVEGADKPVTYVKLTPAGEAFTPAAE